MRAYLIIITTLLSMFGMLKCSQDKIQKQKDEIERLESNQVALLSDITTYRTQEGKLAASVQVLTLSKSEIEKNCIDLANRIRDMDIEIKRLKDVSETAIKSEYEIKSKLEDLVRIRNDPDTIIIDSLKCINYSTPFIYIEGCADKDGTFIGSVITNDTILQAVHIIPKKFLFIKYGVKAIRQNIKMANPDANVVYAKYIQIK